MDKGKSQVTLDCATGIVTGKTVDLGGLRRVHVLHAWTEGFSHPAGATGVITVQLELSLDGEHFWQVPFGVLSFTGDESSAIGLDGTMTQNDVSLIARYARANVVRYVASAGDVSAVVDGMES